ncbi:polysaccharide deacetylase family protein [Candidatus Riflebacteria bacterium]
MKNSIPILYLHRVNEIDPPHLALTPNAFRELLKFLQQNNYKTLKPNELIAALEGKCQYRNPVVLSFDDGYKDNYLFAHPILKQFGMHGIVFVITKYIQEREDEDKEILPFTPTNINAVKKSPCFKQFLTWSQIREMENEKTLFCHSHSHSHRQVFVNGRVDGIYSHTNPHWGIYSIEGFDVPENNFMELKRCSALAKPAFFPDLEHFKKLNSRLEYYDYNQEKFFKEVEREGKLQIKGKIEAPNDFSTRIRKDLLKSKKIIEEKLQKKCLHFCWPWGQSCIESQNIALDLGFKAIYTTQTGPNSDEMALKSLNRYQVRKVNPLILKLSLLVRKYSILARIYRYLKK